MRPEVVQRDDPRYYRRQFFRDLRVTHVGDMGLASHHQVVNLGVESLPDLACGAREINQHLVGVNQVHREPLRLEPIRHTGDALT